MNWSFLCVLVLMSIAIVTLSQSPGSLQGCDDGETDHLHLWLSEEKAVSIPPPPPALEVLDSTRGIHIQNLMHVNSEAGSTVGEFTDAHRNLHMTRSSSQGARHPTSRKLMHQHTTTSGASSLSSQQETLVVGKEIGCSSSSRGDGGESNLNENIETKEIASGRQTREILEDYRLPQRKVRKVTFASARKVPTGPDPLHNSDRSEELP